MTAYKHFIYSEIVFPALCVRSLSINVFNNFDDCNVGRISCSKLVRLAFNDIIIIMLVELCCRGDADHGIYH